MFDYIIQPGDTIYTIAYMFDVSVGAILAANPGLSPYDIYPGLVIRIPISDYLYQRYPWYIFFPILFISRPRRFWDDRMHWPDGWRGGGRPPIPPRPPGPPPGPPRPPRPPIPPGPPRPPRPPVVGPPGGRPPIGRPPGGGFPGGGFPGGRLPGGGFPGGGFPGGRPPGGGGMPGGGRPGGGQGRGR